jgi:hypothetical protein
MAAIVFIAGVRAEELRPIQGKLIDLATIGGIIYYTVQPEGYRVVATLGTATGKSCWDAETLTEAPYGGGSFTHVRSGPRAQAVRVAASSCQFCSTLAGRPAVCTRCAGFGVGAG